MLESKAFLFGGGFLSKSKLLLALGAVEPGFCWKILFAVGVLKGSFV